MATLRQQLAECRKELATTKEDHAEELAVLDQDAVKMQRQVTQARSRETRAKAQIEDSESANRELKQLGICSVIERLPLLSDMTTY